MKYIVLGTLLITAIFAAIMPKIGLGERIAQNITVIRGGIIEAQAYEVTANVQSVRVIINPEKMMINLASYAYGNRVPKPLTASQADIESTIYGIHGKWMYVVSTKCPKGKEFLSSKLVAHHSTGFSFNQSDQWIEEAKTMCGMAKI